MGKIQRAYQAMNTNTNELCGHTHHSKNSAERCAREYMCWGAYKVVMTDTFSHEMQRKKRTTRHTTRRANMMLKRLDSKERVE